MSFIPFAPLKLVGCRRFDSCAPAHLKLAPSPTRSPLPSQFYLLCRFSHKLHSTSRFAHLCCSCPRGSILAPALVTLPSMLAPVHARSLLDPSNSFAFRDSLAPALVALPSMSLIPFAPFGRCNGKRTNAVTRSEIGGELPLLLDKAGDQGRSEISIYAEAGRKPRRVAELFWRELAESYSRSAL